MQLIIQYRYLFWMSNINIQYPVLKSSSMIRMKENWKANAKVTWEYFSWRNVSSRPISVYKEKDSLKTGLGKPRQPHLGRWSINYPAWPQTWQNIWNKSLIAVLECVSVGCVDARLKSSKFASPSENILQLCAPRAVRRAANWLRMKAKVQNYLQSPLS